MKNTTNNSGDEGRTKNQKNYQHYLLTPTNIIRHILTQNEITKLPLPVRVVVDSHTIHRV